MSKVLAELVGALGIDGIGGDDGRLKKLQDASARVAEQFREEPGLLAPAILAALDTEVAGDNPCIALAEAALAEEWQSYETVYPDQPTQLLRAILFAACDRAGDGENGAILWLTAADSMPYSKLGKEEAVVRRMLEKLFSALSTIETNSSSEIISRPIVKKDEVTHQEEYAPFEVDRDQLKSGLTTAFLKNANIHSNYGNINISSWATEAADNLHATLADQIDALADDVSAQQTKMRAALASRLTVFHADFQSAINESRKTSTGEQRRLDTLWWYEALYSPSLHKSYRELDPQLASIVMAMDLLTVYPELSPASVAYVLAEAVARLPDAGYDKPIALADVVANLARLRTQLPSSWLGNLSAPPNDGRLSLRDVVIAALIGTQADADMLLRRAKIAGDITITLPALARTVFRQEQALRLATEAKA